MTRWAMAVFMAGVLSLSSHAGQAADRPVIYTVNYPLQYFAQRIAGEHAEIVFPAPPGVDPAFWQPDLSTIIEYQHADLIVLNGAEYAKWINRTSLPPRKLVDTSAAFRDRYIVVKGTTTHSHGREGEHSHAGTAFTTWLDFSQAIIQAGVIRDALSGLMPKLSETFSENFRALEDDLRDLDARLKQIVVRDPAKPLFASHPVYQYLARRYSLHLESLTWEPDTMPSGTQWQFLEKLREHHSGTWMLWEGKPASAIADRLEQTGIQSIVFNPCGNRPDAGDFLGVMSENLENLEQVFGP